MTDALQPDDYLAIADTLPPSPRILPRLLAVLSDPDSDVSQMVDLISFDPGLTSKLLRACNSAFVGLPEPAGDVAEAVNRLGVAFVYQLAAAVCGSAAYRSSCRNEMASALWRHSVTSAFAAETLAADLALDRGSLFTAALLHDIGKLVLAEKWQEQYWHLMEETQSDPSRLVSREQECFNVTHSELGGRVLAHWKFPPTISSSVWQHAAPKRGMPFERETACVTLAEAIADNVNSKHPVKSLASSPGQETALELLEFTSVDLEPYLSRTQENYQFVNAMCQINL